MKLHNRDAESVAVAVDVVVAVALSVGVVDDHANAYADDHADGDGNGDGHVNGYGPLVWQRASRTILLLISCVLLSGCAATMAYRRGQRAERAERRGDAVRHYGEAVGHDPENPRYRMALANALIESGEAHIRLGEAFERGGEWELAYREYNAAYMENPLNDRALLKRDLARKQVLALASRPDESTVRAPIPNPLDTLAQKDKVNLRLSDTEITDVFLSIERLSGVSFVFDESFKSRKVSVNFQGTNFRDALDRIMMTNRLFYKIVDAKTILVAPDTEAKRAEHEEQIVRTFYLRHADPAKVAANLKSMVELKRVMVTPELKAITIRDGAERLELARRVIEKEDQRRAEVVVDMEILEINRNRLRQYGLDLSTYGVGAAVALDPVTTFPTGSMIRGHMLGSIELSDLIFQVPSVVYRLLRTDTRTRVIARPQLRSAEGETVKIKVGERVPIPMTVFQPVITGGVVPNQPITSYTLTDIGLSVDVKPTVHYNEEVQLACTFELTSIVREGTINQPPVIGNRLVQSSIRLRDGETTIIAGLIKEEERKSRSGLPGISDLPVLGHIFASNNDSGNATDLVITLTPHIVRMAEIDADEQSLLWVGTERALRISDEPPPYEMPRETPRIAPSTQPSSQEMDGSASVRAQRAAPSPEPAPSPNEEPAPTTAAVTVMFDPMDVVVPPGQEFAMRVSVRGSATIGACSFDISFDPAFLDVVRVEPGRTLGDRLTSETNDGRVTIRFEASRGFDGVAARVVFKAKTPGETQLVIDETEATDPSGNNLELTFTPASIRIPGRENEA